MENGKWKMKNEKWNLPVGRQEWKVRREDFSQ